MVLGHTGSAVGAGAIRGAPRETPGEEICRGYARGGVRALVCSCGSGDVALEASLIPKERGVPSMSHSRRALRRASMWALVM